MLDHIPPEQRDQLICEPGLPSEVVGYTPEHVCEQIEDAFEAVDKSLTNLSELLHQLGHHCGVRPGTHNIGCHVDEARRRIGRNRGYFRRHVRKDIRDGNPGWFDGDAFPKKGPLRRSQ